VGQVSGKKRMYPPTCDREKSERTSVFRLGRRGEKRKGRILLLLRGEKGKNQNLFSAAHHQQKREEKKKGKGETFVMGPA